VINFPEFADEVPDEVCRHCPLSYNIHPLQRELFATFGTQSWRLICMRKGKLPRRFKNENH